MSANHDHHLPENHPAAPRADGLPAWITEDLICRTREVWNPYYNFKLTRQEAIGIILTVGRLYGALSRS